MENWAPRRLLSGGRAIRTCPLAHSEASYLSPGSRACWNDKGNEPPELPHVEVEVSGGSGCLASQIPVPLVF